MLIQSILFTKDECESIINLKDKYPLLGDNGRWDEFGHQQISEYFFDLIKNYNNNKKVKFL